MRSTRARSRFAVVAALVPLIAAGGPLVTPALAGSATVTAYHSIGENNVVGPRAGFRNVAQGVSGTTAVLKVDVDSAGTSLNNVEVRLSGFSTGPAIVPDRDFAQNDGFAVYKDVSGEDGLGAPDGVFNEIDHKQLPVSTGYTIKSPTGGQIPIQIAVDGVRATGSTRYFVTVHPGDNAGTIENRDFKLTLPVNGIRFGDATNGPSSAGETPRLTIDSKPPVAPNGRNFTPVSRQPMERQAAPAKEDGYLVAPAENNDPDKTLLFLNDGNNVAEANFLKRPNGAPAIWVTPTAATATEVFIGDGTGITATSKVARNNQVTDDVFVRAFDKLGNLTGAVRLFDNRGGTGDTADRSNDVTATTITPGVVDLHDGSVAHLGINVSNVANAPARVAYTGHTTSGNAATHNNVSATEARMVVTAGGVLSTVPGDATPWGTYPGDSNTTADVVRVNTTGVGVTGSRMTIQARVLDPFGNTSDVFKSATTYLKDITRPKLSAVAFVLDDGNDGIGEAGDKVKVVFSEPMLKSTIAETSTQNPCSPTSTTCINKRLVFPAGGVSWGSNPTVVWAADLASLTVTLGPTNEPGVPENRLPQVNDLVRATESVTDSVGNSPGDTVNSDRFIAPLPPEPIEGGVITKDLGGRNLYNQGRDGYVDGITVTFPFAIENHTTAVEANLPNFRVVGSDTQVPTAVDIHSSTSFTLRFGGVIGSGEQPTLHYTPPATGGLKVGGVAVRDLSVTAIDKAAPAAQLVTTADSNADGHIDEVHVRYSEAIARDPLTGEDQNYRVTGYESFPVCPKLFNTNRAGAGDTPDVTVITLCPGTGAHDTAATPTTATVDYAVSDTRTPANTSATGWGTGSSDNALTFNRILDKAPPVVVSRTTKDTNSNGRIDAIDIVYGETLAGLSVEFARYVVANRKIERTEILGSTGIRLVIEEIAPGRTGDTDSKPTVQYVGGTNEGVLTDASDQRNPVRIDAAPVATTDGAGPAITGACAGTASNNGACPVDTATDDKINVFFSEALTPGTVAAADFVVEQPTGSNKAVTAVAMAADNKSATLTLANNAIDATKDAYVRFPVANTVTDAATPAVGNTQTAAVLAPAAPTVKLDLTCPIAATAGYCGASSVNTGAVATSGLVRFWRLSTTAPTATTPDSEYSPDYPSVYPPSGTLPEGTLTLFLSGKDDYGRAAGVSPTVSDSIVILRAPEIANVGIVNTTTPARGTWPRTDTVVDGDNVSVRATAFSSDADKWTSSNGGCLAQHMSIDYRSLTRVSSQGAVAPFSCDLDTTSFRKSRKMTFPFVKVVGTTRYPVGTVLKQSANDPGWLVVDGPNGTLARRQFVSIGARRSWQITDSSVITVPVSVLNGYPRLTRVGFRDGSVIKTSGSGYYYVYQSVKRPISSGLLAAWKIPLSQTYNVSTGELNAHPTGAGFAYGAHPLGTWIKFSDGSINQITRNGLGQVVRRGVTSSWALRTLVPGSQIYAANHYDRAVPFDATFTRGYRDGVMVKVSSTTYGVVSRTVLRTFANATTFNTMGYNTSNAWPYSPSYLPRTPSGFQTGTPIDRYKLTSVIVKATNLAGGTATKVVLPTVGGLWAIGTLDPRPGNWDGSRQ